MCDGSPPQHMTAQVANSDSKWLCLLSVLSYSLKDRPVPVNKKDRPAAQLQKLGIGILDIGDGKWYWEYRLSVWSLRGENRRSNLRYPQTKIATLRPLRGRSDL